MITLTELFSLLTEYVPDQPSSELLEVCKSRMKEFPYVDFGMDKNFPAPVRGYKFTFHTNDDLRVMLEIQDSKGIILQASFKIVYPGARSSDVFENHLDELLHLAEDSISMVNISKAENVDMFTFSNDNLLVIISTSSFNEQDIITVSVGNNPMWG
jgi:hypothetical protein